MIESWCVFDSEGTTIRSIAFFVTLSPFDGLSTLLFQ